MEQSLQVGIMHPHLTCEEIMGLRPVASESQDENSRTPMPKLSSAVREHLEFLT